MTSFVHVDQPTSHPGVDRAEAVVDHLRTVRKGFDGARGLAVLLLAAIVSSVLVVADKLISNWNDGGLLALWAVLWVVAFASIAYFAAPARHLANRAVVTMRNVQRRRAAARADEQFLAHAKMDPRMMRDLQAVATHQEAELERVAIANPRERRRAIAEFSAATQIPSLYEALRRANHGTSD
jgi:hypothetical protein